MTAKDERKRCVSWNVSERRNFIFQAILLLKNHDHEKDLVLRRIRTVQCIESCRQFVELCVIMDRDAAVSAVLMLGFVLLSRSSSETQIQRRFPRLGRPNCSTVRFRCPSADTARSAAILKLCLLLFSQSLCGIHLSGGKNLCVIIRVASLT